MYSERSVPEVVGCSVPGVVGLGVGHSGCSVPGVVGVSWCSLPEVLGCGGQ